MPSDTIEFQTFVQPHGGQFIWFVIGDYNNHVLAQGCSKREATANRQVKEAVLLLKAGLWQAGKSE